MTLKASDPRLGRGCGKNKWRKTWWPNVSQTNPDGPCAKPFLIILKKLKIKKLGGGSNFVLLGAGKVVAQNN